MRDLFNFFGKVILCIIFSVVCALFAGVISNYHLAIISGFAFGFILSSLMFGLFNEKSYE